MNNFNPQRLLLRHNLKCSFFRKLFNICFRIRFLQEVSEEVGAMTPMTPLTPLGVQDDVIFNQPRRENYCRPVSLAVIYVDLLSYTLQSDFLRTN